MEKLFHNLFEFVLLTKSTLQTNFVIFLLIKLHYVVSFHSRETENNDKSSWFKNDSQQSANVGLL